MEFVKNLQSFLQSYNKSLINQACSGPYWENIGPRSFLYGPHCAQSILSRPQADILPVRPSRLVNKIYLSDAVRLTFASSIIYAFSLVLRFFHFLMLVQGHVFVRNESCHFQILLILLFFTLQMGASDVVQAHFLAYRHSLEDFFSNSL